MNAWFTGNRKPHCNRPVFRYLRKLSPFVNGVLEPFRRKLLNACLLFGPEDALLFFRDRAQPLVNELL